MFFLKLLIELKIKILFEKKKYYTFIYLFLILFIIQNKEISLIKVYILL